MQLEDRILRELSRDYLAVLHLLVVGGHGTGAYAPFRVKGAVTSEVANPSSTGMHSGCGTLIFQ